MNQNSIINLLQKCTEYPNLQIGKSIHAYLIKPSFPSPYLHNHILNFYLKTSQLNYALNLFDKIPDRNSVTWSSIISGFVKHGCPDQALSLFSSMRVDTRVHPDEFTLVSAIKACALSENCVFLYQIYAYVVRVGFLSNVFVANAFLSGLVRCGKMLDATLVFDECVGKDVVSWNSMMSGYLKFCSFDLPGFWRRIGNEGVKPDHFSYATILADLSDLKFGFGVHSQLIKSGHGADVCVGNSLFNMYLKNSRMDDSLNVFREMSCRDVRSWTQLASGFLQYEEPGKALELISDMLKIGLNLNKFTLATALNACANLASVESGKMFHGLRIKLGYLVDVCVDNALIDMYAKTGCLDEARVVFLSMPSRSVVSWTSMIMGCGQNGQPKEALKFFDKMKTEIEPNYITFICVLYACSQGGFVDDGWKYFLSMSNDYRISPGEHHYACMVNLLGRAGHIKEAEKFILGMPFEPGVLVWQTLLAACKLHEDMETGKRAAEEAMKLDGIDPSTYVSLSNMFADLKNWDSVGTLRKVMENRDVKKVPGFSWI
ncbi:Pentatricopeptide repeat (PPR) superfamily protein [Euphorbia peplus]|nr:Pentatricopeptide repeat (PPR) superfamily protein [Euphorbia peplus]